MPMRTWSAIVPHIHMCIDTITDMFADRWQKEEYGHVHTHWHAHVHGHAHSVQRHAHRRVRVHVKGPPNRGTCINMRLCGCIGMCMSACMAMCKDTRTECV